MIGDTRLLSPCCKILKGVRYSIAFLKLMLQFGIALRIFCVRCSKTIFLEEKHAKT